MYSLGNSTSRCNMANDRFIKRGLYLKKGRKVISRSSRFGKRFRPMSAPMSSLFRVMVKQCLPTPTWKFTSLSMSKDTIILAHYLLFMLIIYYLYTDTPVTNSY